MKIEKGIPLPRKGSGAFAKPLGPMASILRSQDFEVGDSFLVDESLRKSAASILTQSSKVTGRKFAQRKTADGLRVWRIA